jgi:hypothetical protein
LSSLQSFGPDIWLADGSEADVAGFRYPTRMAVIRLTSGGLFVWSPVMLSPGLRAEVEALGEVRHLVAPNSLHHLFLGEWRRAYPRARLYAAPGLRPRRPDLAFDGDLGDTPPPDWVADLDQAAVLGNAITTEIVFFHRKSGTVLFTDLIQQFPPGWFTGWRALVARLDLMVGTEPSVPRKFRAAFTDRKAARSALRRILAWPSSKVVMAHGAPVEHDAQAFLARAFRWLKP